MATSASTLLDETNAEISRLLSGAQRYTVRGKSLDRARLKDLRELRQELLAEVQQESNGGSMTSLGIMVPLT